MILTVTANPAYDVTYRVPRLTPGAVHRVTHVSQRVGGKGVNVTRVLAALGVDSRAIVLADKAFGAAGQAEGVVLDVVEEMLSVRRTVVVHDDHGETTSLWEPGSTVSSRAGERLRQRVADLLPQATGLVVAGSLPPGVPAALVAALAGDAVTAGVPVVVDADDDALGVAARVPGVVLMPNSDELGRLAGAVVRDLPEAVAAAADLVDAGAAAVVATRGAEGMVAVTRDGAWHGRLDRGLAGNPTGAGDAAAAAVVRGLAGGAGSWPDLLREAVATSAAAVCAPVAGLVDVADIDRLRPRVVLEPVQRAGRVR